jgi:hypothetical protein
MKTKVMILVLLIACLFSAYAFDEDYLNRVTFENLTDQTIEFIFLSPGDSEYWGPEILGSDRILEVDESLGFFIWYPNECDNFDIMAIGEDGSTFIIWDYEICDGTEELIEFVRKDLIEEAPDVDFVNVHIQNETISIYYIFLSPADSDMWGVDYLDEVTILETDEYVSFLFPATDEAIEYDLMAIDEDGDEYTFSFDIDLSSDDDVYAIEISDLQYD